MIPREFIKSLSDEELNLVLNIINIFNKSVVEVNEAILASYRLDSLRNQLVAAKDRIKEEYLELYKIVCAKFDIKVEQ